ncbi:MAG: AI-2E family transporter [Myxococcota bacterium]
MEQITDEQVVPLYPSQQRVLAGVVALAGVCVIGAAIIQLQSVLVQLSFAAMLAAVLWPPTIWLQRRGAPRIVALGLVSVGATLTVLVGASILAQSAEGFITAIPTYGTQLEALLNTAVETLAGWGVNLDTLQAEGGAIEPDTLLGSLGSLLSGIASLASNAFMIILIGLFLLAEGDGLSRKVTLAFGEGATSAQLLSVGASLQSYVMLKTLTSGLTGLLVAAGLWLIDLPHAVLWGFVAFLLNYIPNIGSIIAAIPPILLALIVGGPLTATLVTALYLAANLGIGSILEPRIMGDTLGLSALVILLALLLWGHMWGAAGMLLSVPLTVVICEFAAISDTTRWISILLGPNPEETQPPEETTPAPPSPKSAEPAMG